MSKKLFLLGAVLILLVAIPLTVYLAQQQQETRSRAAKATTLSLIESGKTLPSSQSTPIQKQVGQKVSLDVVMDPGTNTVSVLTLHISYDPKTATVSGIIVNRETAGITTEPKETTPGNIIVLITPNYLSNIGVDPTKTIQTQIKIATVTIEALAITPVGSPTEISFGSNTEVLSSSKADAGSENVLSSTSNAFIAIAAGLSPTPTPTPIAGTNQPPVCSALNVDRTPSGAAPFSITFTANGTDSDGTISKVTFDFGDGPVQDLAQAGGIGTKSVSAQIAHTYNNSGTFKALAILTDDKGGISTSSASCTQTITVTPSVGGTGDSSSGSATPTPILPTETPTPIPTSTPIQQLPIEEPGPSNTIIGVGAVGAILSIVGAILFFAL